MGKGPSTPQSNVQKQHRNLTDDQSVVAKQGGGSKGSDSKNAKMCMISFAIDVKDTDNLLAIGSKVAIVPATGGGLQIISSANKVADYNGSNASILAKCIKMNYVYVGEVVALSEGVARCEFSGLGPA